MALQRFTTKGPEPELRDGEAIECLGCRQRHTAEDVASWLPDYFADDGDGRVECPTGCVKGFVRRQASSEQDRALAARWPAGVIAEGFTALPDLLLLHAGELGLDLTDCGLIAQLEHHRRGRTAQVYPSYRSLATRSGVSERTVSRRVEELERRGLIEADHRRRPDGSNSSLLYRRDGLDEALALIAKNRQLLKPASVGLDHLLATLAERGTRRRNNRVRSKSGSPGQSDLSPATH